MKTLINKLIHWTAKAFSSRSRVTIAQRKAYLEEAERMLQQLSDWLNGPHEAIALGQNCNASWYLKETGNKHASYPFDLIYTTPAIIEHMLEDDFQQFLNRELIIPHGFDGGHHLYHETLFGHRNPLRSDGDYAYYERCVARWRSRMAAQPKVVFVTVVLNEPEKRKRFREGFTKQFSLPTNQKLEDFEAMMAKLLAINPNCKFLFIEQYTEMPFGLQVRQRTERAFWLRFDAVDRNTGVQYLHDADDAVMQRVLRGLKSDSADSPAANRPVGPSVEGSAMSGKRTLVVGASPNPQRYSYMAVERLTHYGHPVRAYGVQKGSIGEVAISDEWPSGPFDTVTLYLNPQRQEEFYDRLLKLRPKRVIFNPGTENRELEKMLKAEGIEAENACTLVLLSMGNY